MGYRVRLGKFPKCEYHKYENKSFDNIQSNMDEEFFPYTPKEHEELYEIGKYISFTDDTCKSFYSFNLDDEEFYIISKEKLKGIIESYSVDVKSFYDKIFKSFGEFIVAKENIKENIDNEDFDLKKAFNDLFTNFEKERELLSTLMQKKNDWSSEYYSNYILKEDWKRSDGQMSRSWLKEYAIFNLTFIYNTFDWENDFLIYSGW